MSEFQRANSFGTGYLDTNSVFTMKIENKSKKRHFEVAGDDKCLKAFGELGNELTSYHYDNTQKCACGSDGKDYFVIELTSPETTTHPYKEKMMKIVDYKTYMKLITKYHIVSEGKWKEWKQVNGKPKAVRVQE
tara:strand:- start:252 stop:653 length:402 start_codon:yes stop_codon:yes gene_type:complete